MEPETARPDTRNSWIARPFLSALIRVGVFLGPSVLSLTAALLLARALGPPAGGTATVLWWAGILGASFAVLLVAQNLARRLAPLAVLMSLTLRFPDRAPSRYRVARRSGNVAELRRQIAETADADLGHAAETILALATALSAHDRQTRGHSERVRVFSDMLAEEMRLPAEERDRLRWAALLHDIGKLEVPSEILNKDGPLDEDEWKIIRQHPAMGIWMMGSLAGWLGPQIKTIEQHHERYDGNGYPNRLAGEKISIGGRIVAVADSYETMTAVRPYKKPLGASAAREELSRCAGTQFDPGVVRAMLNISLGKLLWRVGLISWLAQVPLFGGAARWLTGATRTASHTTATAAVTATVIGAVSLLVPAIMSDEGVELPTPEGGILADQGAQIIPPLTLKEDVIEVLAASVDYPVEASSPGAAEPIEGIILDPPSEVEEPTEVAPSEESDRPDIHDQPDEGLVDQVVRQVIQAVETLPVPDPPVRAERLEPPTPLS